MALITARAVHARWVGSAFLGCYRTAAHVRSKCFSLLSSGAFSYFGAGSVIEPPIRLSGERCISIGSGVFIGAGSWLQVLSPLEDRVALEIGDGALLSGACVISAASRVRIGKRVGIAPRCVHLRPYACIRRHHATSPGSRDHTGAPRRDRRRRMARRECGRPSRGENRARSSDRGKRRGPS